MTDTVEAPKADKKQHQREQREAALEALTGDGANVGTEDGANVGTTPAKVVEDDDDVLDLTSLVPSRKLVRIPTPDNPKGETFELRLLDDFGIVDQQRLLSWSRRFEALWNKEESDLTDSESATLKHLLDQMFVTVLDAPQEVKEAIPDHIRSRVITSFTLVPLLERQKQEEAEREARDKANDSKSDSES